MHVLEAFCNKVLKTTFQNIISIFLLLRRDSISQSFYFYKKKCSPREIQYHIRMTITCQLHPSSSDRDFSCVDSLASIGGFFFDVVFDFFDDWSRFLASHKLEKKLKLSYLSFLLRVEHLFRDSSKRSAIVFTLRVQVAFVYILRRTCSNGLIHCSFTGRSEVSGQQN